MRLRVFNPKQPLDIFWTLAPLNRPPVSVLHADRFIRATRSPEGPATISVEKSGREIHARAWGPGAEWAIEHAGDLIGISDDPTTFRPDHPALQRLARMRPGLRIGRTLRVFESLLCAVIDQKVTSAEARRSYAVLVQTYGERAPGPFDLLVPPAPDSLATLPYWAFHRFAIEERRAATIKKVAASAAKLEEASDLSGPEAEIRMRAIPGVGRWTAAEVRRDALGDPDAVSVGDFHLPDLVAWVLQGEPRGDDDRILELLAPYSPQRGRAIKLIESSGLRAPAYGPRRPVRGIAGI